VFIDLVYLSLSNSSTTPPSFVKADNTSLCVLRIVSSRSRIERACCLTRSSTSSTRSIFVCSTRDAALTFDATSCITYHKQNLRFRTIYCYNELALNSLNCRYNSSCHGYCAKRFYNLKSKSGMNSYQKANLKAKCTNSYSQSKQRYICFIKYFASAACLCIVCLHKGRWN
jgi:hypothetical protein